MIRSVHFSNFKSLASVTVELDPVTVFVGRSGTGKTNFIGGLRFLRDILKRPPLPNDPNAFDDLTDFTHAGRSDRPIAFSVCFDVPGIHESFRYSLTIEQKKEHRGVWVIAGENLHLGNGIIFDRDYKTWRHRPPVPISNPHGLGIRTISGIPEVTAAYQLLAEGIGCYDFPGNVLQSDEKNQKGVNDIFGDNGANYLRAMVAIYNDIRNLTHPLQINAAVKKIAPSLQSLGIERPNPSRLDVIHQMGEQRKRIVGDESEGFRRFLAHMLALYQKPAKFVLAFEEPEKGIYPGALAVLADEFKAAPSDDRGQVLLTTHSPQLLDHFPPERVRVVEIDRFETKIGRVSPEQYAAIKESLMTTGELLTADPARLAEETPEETTVNGG